MTTLPNHERFPAASYIDPSARLYGSITLGANVWPHVAVRAECQDVRIGRYTNLQDHVMIHVGFGLPTIVGDYCSITHRVVLHGCTVGDNCLIGIGATLMDGVVLGENSIVAGHTFLREGTVIPPNSIVMGTPGKVVRTANNLIANRLNALLYHRNAQHYARGEHRAWHGPEFERWLAEQKRELEQRFAATSAKG